MWEKSKRTTKCDKRTVTCDVGITQYDDRTVKCEKQNKGTTEYDKKTVICDIGTTQCEDEIVKCEKKSKWTPNVKKKKKKLSHMMLELYNVKIKPSNVIKK